MVPDEEFESAGEFLAALRPSPESWGQVADPLDFHWRFRGQGDASWNLRPGLFREPADARFAFLWHEAEERLKQRAREFASLGDRFAKLFLWHFVEDRLLRYFVQHCAATALGLPAEAPEFHGRVASDPGGITGLDGQPNIVSAIAQHHGVATRLLDFTRDARVAALFAALDCLRQRLVPSHVAVWAVQRKLSNPRRVEWLDVPRHLDQNIHAQSGVLAFDVEADKHFLKEGVWPQLEDALLLDVGEEGVRKLTLSSYQVMPLLDLLAREQLTLAHIRPGYDGCGEAVMLRHVAFPQNPGIA